MPISFSRKHTAIILTMLFLLCSSNLKAQHSDDAAVGGSIRDHANNNDFVVRLTRYDVKPDHQTAFRKVVSDYVVRSLGQDSNVLSEAYYEQEDPSVLWIIERWDSKIELEKACTSPSFKAIESLAKTALSKPAERIDVKDLEPIAKQQWRSVVKKTDDPITIMLFVDAKAGTEHNFKTVYHTAMPQFRGEPGVVTYQLSQLEADSTQFVTYEKFRSEDAFQYHLKFPPIQPVIDYLNTSIKKQPFQSGLHRLIEFAPLIRK
ncbi:putative quinol monooxygenase [Parachryseolinea silvisoli]|uniref:putative quinol monooxygenase n=1 Tax=Parachryseolinea silvisoli TaxID=2873601 RepID=UPI002265C6C8|nr:antibiotic biosynthesis monooxygenase family protein [Parachryseolinea silvisoli]MCD9019202.1 antibiotic biosynthesis monooxygenase [Parachryseolinea silvisoli]